MYDFRQIVLGDYKIGANPDCERKNRETKRSGGSCFKKVTRSASKVIIHESYDSNSTLATNDIALIRLKKPVPLFDDANGTSTYGDPKVNKHLICETFDLQNFDSQYFPLLEFSHKKWKTFDCSISTSLVFRKIIAMN